jgi:hypothetical protein
MSVLLHDVRPLILEDRTMDNVQNSDSYINIPGSQNYR